MSPQHAYRDGDEWGVTVAELINKVVTEGLGLRLNWRNDVPHSWFGAGDPTDFPTAELPVLWLPDDDHDPTV